MVEQWVYCDVIMTLVNSHSHDDSSMRMDDLLDNADGGMDRNRLQEAVEQIVEDLDFLTEWGHYRNTRVHLRQETGEVVHYLVEDCGENPNWIEPSLSHVPNDVWDEYGVTPS